MQKQKYIPALRFPEFKSEWERKKVGELCDCIVPGRNKPTDFDGEIPWITTPDIEHNGIITFSKKGLNISEEQAKKIGSKIVPKNSIIISCVGDLGLSAIAGKKIVINQQLHAFLPKEQIEYRFLLYQLNSQKKYMEMVATKTAVPYMNKDNCNSIPISFPALPEQKRIASFFTALDQKITQLKQKKTLLEQYKDGAMQKLLSQELRFKDNNGKAYPKWEIKKLGQIGECFIGLTYSPKDVVETGGVLVLRSSNVQNQTLAFDDNVYVSTDISEKNFVKENDILICARNGSRSLIGKCALIKKEHEGFAFGAFMSIYRSDFNSYLYQIFQTDLFFKQVN